MRPEAPRQPADAPEAMAEGRGISVGGSVLWRDGKLTLRYKCWGPDLPGAATPSPRTASTGSDPTWAWWSGAARRGTTSPGAATLALSECGSRRRRTSSGRCTVSRAAARGSSSRKMRSGGTGAPPGRTCFELRMSSDVFYDPCEERYVATYKTANRRHRAVGIALSKDGLEWQKPVEGAVFGADDLDPDATQVYGMPAFVYQGMYIGIPRVSHHRPVAQGPGGTSCPRNCGYEAQEGSPRTIDVELAWSWNLISWTRPPKREPFIGLGEPGSWERGMVGTRMKLQRCPPAAACGPERSLVSPREAAVRGPSRERCAGSLCPLMSPANGQRPLAPPLLPSTQRPTPALLASSQ